MEDKNPPPQRSRRLSAVEAESVMLHLGLRPLSPFPGSNTPWPAVHVECGREVAPTLTNVRRCGGACRHCAREVAGAKRRASLAERAAAEMRAAGFEPLVPYPGTKAPWLCLHTRCGIEVTPNLNAVRRNGTACRRCSTLARGHRFWTPADAETFLASVGLEPLEPFPGSSSKPWRCRHSACGRIVAPRLGNIANGQGACRECGLEATHQAHQLDPTTAAALMRTAGLEPLDPYPGVDARWRCRHEPCGTEVHPTYSNIKAGQGDCTKCAAQAASVRLRMAEDDAVEVFAMAGLTPIEPYPGSMRPWRAQHSCGGTVSPTLSNVRVGKGICRYCNSSFPFRGEADVYLVSEGTALKVGICGPRSARLATHRRYGWQHLWSLRVATGDLAYQLEQSVIRWWRRDLKLAAAYRAAEMPQYGATETVLVNQMTPGRVLAFACDRLNAEGHAFSIIEPNSAQLALF